MQNVVNHVLDRSSHLTGKCRKKLKFSVSSPWRLLIVMAQYSELYRISRYWKHIVLYPYRDSYCSIEFDILHHLVIRFVSNKPLIAIGMKNREQQRGVISITFQGGMVHSVDQPIGGGMSLSAWLGWVYVCLACSPMHLKGSWRLAYAFIKPNEKNT